ncbi:MAG: hypothetical protein ABI612_12465, partial [Betaproteobacteria bacterium]
KRADATVRQICCRGLQRAVFGNDGLRARHWISERLFFAMESRLSIELNRGCLKGALAMLQQYLKAAVIAIVAVSNPALRFVPCASPSVVR